MSRFHRDANFHALSVRDLAEARDAYHVYLANLDNVVGTALGRYLIRREDPDFHDPDTKRHAWSTEPRQLSNSGVTPWSWPCVLVFVNNWMVEPPDGSHADQVIPKRLSLPDGRQVPTCVVYTPVAPPAERDGRFQFGSVTRGPGQPLLTEDQDRRRVGTIGALVTDGSLVFALTSRHVLGADQSPAYVADRGQLRQIGTTSALAMRNPLETLYPGFGDARAQLSLDAGLVQLDSVDGWTTQLYGLGVPGELIDVNVDTVALGLIGCPVRAYGAASGPLQGAVLGLFHRWRSVGGVDQIAELLIGPRPGDRAVQSRPGDSGAVWVWDEDAERTAEGNGETPTLITKHRELPVVRPLALQWGGGVVLDSAGNSPTDYVLASTLASVSVTLGVNLLHDDSLADHSLYWGKVGHYKIAEAACSLAKPGTKLDQLLRANLERIAVTDDDIANGNLPSARHGDAFVALADVPDLVWRATRHKDAPSHFADMDEPGGDDVAGKSLMQLWAKGGHWRTPAGWTEFYDTLAEPPEDKHRGGLPFRVAQLYDVMVGAVRKKDVASYVTAAGVLAHYVGDACQPLHVSRLHHGDPDNKDDDKVHGAYETDMLDQHAPEIVTGVNDALNGWHVGRRKGPQTFKGADEAADTVVQLMRRTIRAITPADIVDVYMEQGGAGRVARLWDQFGTKTINRLADGAKTLAVIWQSAWDEGRGETIAASKVGTQSEDALKKLYGDKCFAENTWLKDQ